MRRSVFAVLASLFCLCACDQQPGHNTAARGARLPAEQVPLGRLPDVVVPERYRIQLSVDPKADRFSGHAEIDVVFSEKRRAIFIDGQGLNVLGAGVRLSARKTVPAHYLQVDKSGVARLLFVDEIPAGKATLVFDYDAPFGKQLSGLYKVADKGDAYAFTQLEPDSAREMFPSFDEPGFKTPFQLSVTAPAVDKVVSNTQAESVRRGDSGAVTTTFAWTRPLPTYLVALAVGPFDIVDGGDIAADAYRRRPVHLRGIAARGEGGRMRYALSMAPQIVSTLENYFGIAYPFPKLDLIAVPDFGANAMENAGAIMFRERMLLLDPGAAVDQKRSSVYVMSHEITHQWFGDLVTPAWWNGIWLNESFASWLGYKTAQAVAPDLQFDTETLRDGLDVMDRDTLPSARRVAEPVNGPDDLAGAFDSVVYDKGAAILAMYEDYLGDDVFRHGVRAYLQEFAFRNATTEDFVGAIATASSEMARSKPEDVTIHIDRTGAIFWNGHRVPNEAAVIDQMSHMPAGVSPGEITASFRSFLDQPGVPNLKIHMQCDRTSAFAHITQGAYTPIGHSMESTRWSVPLCLDASSGDKICRLLDRKSADVLLGATCPAVLAPNAEGKGYYRYSLDEGAWQALIGALPKADPAGQIAFLANLDAALHAGQATAADLLAAIRAVAPTARWDVLLTVDTILQRLRVEAIAPADLPAYRNFVQTLFAPRLAQMGLAAKPEETPAQSLAREQLVTLLVSEARDPAVVSELKGSVEVALTGGAGSAAPEPELMGEAMRAALLVGGAPMADRLVAAYGKSDDEFFRRQVIYAFAGSDDPAIVGKILAIVPKMRAGEIRYLAFYMGDETAARGAFWAWYKKNYDALLARLPNAGAARVAAALSEACDANTRADLQGFFDARTASLTRRALALSEESIDRCVAFKWTKAGEIAAALKSVR
jgi:alanyl aminopeptidase